MSKPNIALMALMSASLYGMMPERSDQEYARLYGTKRNPGNPVPVINFDIPEPKQKKKPYGAPKLTRRQRKQNEAR